MNRETLEEQQIWIYGLTILLAAPLGLLWKESYSLAVWVEPVIAFLLYSMFCQIPFLQLKKVFHNRSFFKALLFGNFVLIPCFVWLLSTIFLQDPVIILSVFLVLLCPCIDYVIVFTHLGKGDSKSILAATPLLFILQMLLLPVYLVIFTGKESAGVIDFEPFIKSFLYLIAGPFFLAVLTEIFAGNFKTG